MEIVFFVRCDWFRTFDLSGAVRSGRGHAQSIVNACVPKLRGPLNIELASTFHVLFRNI